MMSQYKNRIVYKMLFMAFGLFILPKVYADEKVISSSVEGESIYRARCALCHGSEGRGNGRLAKMIVLPPPADFTKSFRTKAYLIKMVTLGGEAMGRSPQMPVWGQELSKQQVEDVVDYIYTLRESFL